MLNVTGIEAAPPFAALSAAVFHPPSAAPAANDQLTPPNVHRPGSS